MRYNEKYDRWFTKGGLVYRYDSKQDKLVLCKQYKDGYPRCCSNGKHFRVHRAMYETFVGEIPSDFEIDHINTIKNDNRIENLRAVTHGENINNPLTRQHISNSVRNTLNTDFGKKYFEHYGYSNYENPKQYNTEYVWYRKHNNKCRWEVK